MAQIKYQFNVSKLIFEKVKVSWTQRIFRFFSFIAATSLFAFLILVIAYTYLDSPKEKQLKREIEFMQEQIAANEERIDLMKRALTEIENRDNDIYRVIFETEPNNANVVTVGSKLGAYKAFNNYEVLRNVEKKLNTLSKKLYIQSTSLEEIGKLAQSKQKMLASIPAIRPLSFKQLKALASGFGYRIDPIYKTVKMHTGLDFTAPTGSKIIATGEGIVVFAGYASGYGYHVIINHGFGYQTLYGHMSKILVRPGKKVFRGDEIGLVGSTGKSTAPHLHYEVIKSGTKINPINFFYNDITPSEYEQLLLNAESMNQSFD